MYIPNVRYATAGANYRLTGKKANVVIFKTDLTYSDLINTLAVTDIQTLIDVACIYAEQVACTVGRPSVCLSVPSIDSSNAGRRVCCWAPCGRAAGSVLQDQQRMRVASCWEPTEETRHRLVIAAVIELLNEFWEWFFDKMVEKHWSGLTAVNRPKWRRLLTCLLTICSQTLASGPKLQLIIIVGFRRSRTTARVLQAGLNRSLMARLRVKGGLVIQTHDILLR